MHVGGSRPSDTNGQQKMFISMSLPKPVSHFGTNEFQAPPKTLKPGSTTTAFLLMMFSSRLTRGILYLKNPAIKPSVDKTQLSKKAPSIAERIRMCAAERTYGIERRDLKGKAGLPARVSSVGDYRVVYSDEADDNDDARARALKALATPLTVRFEARDAAGHGISLSKFELDRIVKCLLRGQSFAAGYLQKAGLLRKGDEEATILK